MRNMNRLIWIAMEICLLQASPRILPHNIRENQRTSSERNPEKWLTVAQKQSMERKEGDIWKERETARKR